jgi:hypothetical protein
MNKGRFEAKINQAAEVFGRVSLIEQRNYFPDFSDFDASELRSGNYVEHWTAVYKRRWYHFRLINGSLLQFRRWQEKGQIKLSYSYLDCPFKILSYGTWLTEQIGDCRDDGESFWDEYEKYVESAVRSDSVSPIRYYFDPSSYTEGVHPNSHVHLGFSNQIRIGTYRIWNPLYFAVFVIRQCFPTQWLVVVNHKSCAEWGNNVRDALDESPHILDSEINKMESILF